MQVKGEQFIKKVQLQQEREELEQKLNELEEAEQTYTQEDPVIIEESVSNKHELDNIMLDTNELPNENDTKRKYLILGIVLVVLFLLTIIIIRLLTGDDKEDSFTSSKVDSMEMKKIEENSNIEENFQKIIDERIKKDTQDSSSITAITSEEKIEKISNPISNVEIKDTINDNTLDETIKKIEEKTKEIKKEEKKVELKPKKSIKTLIKESSKVKTTNSIKGYFIQIGAFIKTPSSNYINKIRNAGLKYKIYRVKIKGTMYNKVLIGPYSSRVTANKNISTIKNKLNLSSAYVLKF